MTHGFAPAGDLFDLVSKRLTFGLGGHSLAGVNSSGDNRAFTQRGHQALLHSASESLTPESAR